MICGSIDGKDHVGRVNRKSKHWTPAWLAGLPNTYLRSITEYEKVNGTQITESCPKSLSYTLAVGFLWHSLACV
jgi:hypothetical protein